MGTRHPAQRLADNLRNVEPVNHPYEIEQIRFMCDNTEIVGMLLRPGTDQPVPAVTVLGPVAFVKEQAPIQYATRLAGNGVAALVFDPARARRQWW